MPNILDDTASILSRMGLTATKVTTPPGYAGLQVNLPNDSQAFFVWQKIDNEDFAFRIARFWSSDNPMSMMVCPTLIDALARTQVFINRP